LASSSFDLRRMASLPCLYRLIVASQVSRMKSRLGMVFMRGAH
jgi:hypothetical protein